MRPELIRAAELLKNETPEAVEEAISLLQKTVYSFSMKVCGHPQDAEDTMQEVLFRSIPHLARIQDPRALAVWLYTVTRNRCWRMRSKPKAASRTQSLDELMPDSAELARLLQDAAENPEGSVLRAERHDLLHRAVLRIPAPLRIVLVLHDMEELTTEQVGQVLDLQPGTVRVRLHRARLMVRRELNRMAERSPSTTRASDSVRKARKSKPVAVHRSTACHELFANLSEYLDGRLQARSCDEIRKHIDGCPACVAFLRDLRAAIDRCRSMEVPCDPAVARRLRALLTSEYLRMLGIPVPKEISAAM